MALLYLTGGFDIGAGMRVAPFLTDWDGPTAVRLPVYISSFWHLTWDWTVDMCMRVWLRYLSFLPWP